MISAEFYASVRRVVHDDDAVQDAFLACLNKRPDHPRTYHIQAARRFVAYRARWDRAHPTYPLEEAYSPNDTAHTVMVRDTLRQCLAIMAREPSQRRYAIAAHLIHGLPYDVIASQLSVGSSAVRMWVHRYRRRLVAAGVGPASNGRTP